MANHLIGLRPAQRGYLHCLKTSYWKGGSHKGKIENPPNVVPITEQMVDFVKQMVRSRPDLFTFDEEARRLTFSEDGMAAMRHL
jgi:hypothetical protein